VEVPRPPGGKAVLSYGPESEGFYCGPPTPELDRELQSPCMVELVVDRRRRVKRVELFRAIREPTAVPTVQDRGLVFDRVAHVAGARRQLRVGRAT